MPQLGYDKSDDKFRQKTKQNKTKQKTNKKKKPNYWQKITYLKIRITKLSISKKELMEINPGGGGGTPIMEVARMKGSKDPLFLALLSPNDPIF